jgi:hypothetical protein
MEDLFSPCTFLRELLDSVDHSREKDWENFDEWHDVDLFQELNLNVSTEEFLSAKRAFTYADFYAMLGNAETVAWLTPHASISRDNGSECYRSFLQGHYRCFDVDGKGIVALATSPKHLLEISDVFSIVGSKRRSFSISSQPLPLWIRIYQWQQLGVSYGEVPEPQDFNNEAFSFG